MNLPASKSRTGSGRDRDRRCELVKPRGGEFLRVHRFLSFSRANGPGIRAVVWVQGCSLGCPGCFNPGMHSPAGGEFASVDDLFERVVALGGDIEGISVSGGEPLQQWRPLLALLQRVRRETQLSILMFTGYSWQELQRMPEVEAVLACVDVLIAGRYDESLRAGDGLLGSENQTVHVLTGRYSERDLRSVPPAEVIVTADGDILVSGVDPVRM